MATEVDSSSGGESGVEKLEKEIEAYQIRQGAAIASMVSKVATYAIKKLEEFFGAPIEQVLDFLEQNPDVLDFNIIDEELRKIQNPAVKIAINALVRAGGTFLKRHDGWREQFLEQGEMYILLALKKHNPRLYDLLKDRPRVVQFIKGYIAHKLGL